jgi:integrase
MSDVAQMTIIELYTHILKEMGQAPSTIRAYANAVKGFLEYCGYDNLTQDLTEQIKADSPKIADYIQKQIGSQQIRVKCALLLFYSAVINAPVEKTITQSEAGDIEPLTHKTIDNDELNPISRETMQMLIKESIGNLKVAIVLIYGHGCQVNDVLNIRLDDYDPNTHTLRIRTNGNGTFKHTITLYPCEVPIIERQYKKASALANRKTYIRNTYVRHPQTNEYTSEPGMHYLLFNKRSQSDMNQGGLIYKNPVNRASLLRNLERLLQNMDINEEISFRRIRDTHGVHSYEAGESVTDIFVRLGFAELKTAKRFCVGRHTSQQVSPQDVLIACVSHA